MIADQANGSEEEMSLCQFIYESCMCTSELSRQLHNLLILDCLSDMNRYGLARLAEHNIHGDFFCPPLFALLTSILLQN